MKIRGCYGVFGYAVVAKIIHTFPDGNSITEERVITLCLDMEQAELIFNTLVINDFFCEYELDAIEEFSLQFEEWEFSDNPDNFDRVELKMRQLR